ncbi:hypothetical protein TacPo2_10 [Pantoea bacteriophage TacPo2]
MATIAQIIGHNSGEDVVDTHPLIVGRGRVGLELELENMPNARQAHGWTVTGDGSLRNSGVEYVLRGAQGGMELFGSILSLEDALVSHQCDANLRCSTHVHLDVRRLTVPRLKRLLLAYTVYERLIFELSGVHRMTNNFCPAYGFAQQQIRRLALAWNHDGERFLTRIVEGRDRQSSDKYSALNLVPIFTQGSIEFRGAEAKASAGKMLRLANRILSLYDIAVNTDLRMSDAEFINSLANIDVQQAMLGTLPRDFEINQEFIDEGRVLAFDIISLGQE